MIMTLMEMDRDSPDPDHESSDSRECSHTEEELSGTQCHRCLRTFLRPEGLYYHRKAHRVKRHRCRIRCCNRTFDFRYHMLAHYRQVHSDEPMWECILCPKAFQLHVELLEHERKVHLEKRLYYCDQCPKTFWHEGVLVRHRISHTTAERLKCPRCQKYFKDQCALEKHLIITHLDTTDSYYVPLKRRKIARHSLIY